MKASTANILNHAGLLLRYIGYKSITHFVSSIRNRIYTGIYKTDFSHFGNSCFEYPAKSIIGAKNISIGTECTFEPGLQLEAWGENANIQIGNNCLIRANSHITAIKSIIIEDGLLTGDNVLISDNSHGNNSIEDCAIAPLKRTLSSKGGIHIGKNVWLGNNVCILSSVNIGEGAVIGANSVVTHDIPSYSISAGCPAKVIRTIK